MESQSIPANAQVNRHRITWSQLNSKIVNIFTGQNLNGKAVYGIPRGGAVCAIAMARLFLGIQLVDKPGEADIIVDDLIDSGRTRDQYRRMYPQTPFYAIYDKIIEPDLGWLVFPYESDKEAEKSVEDCVARILEFHGYNLNSEGLKRTPERVAKVYAELLHAEEPVIAIFNAKGYNQMITDKDIPFYSLCEHHILPFFGTVAISYIPDKSIIGLSKLARIVDYFSRRLNTQEYLAQNIANYIEEKLKPQGVGVIVRGRHLCKEMRGVRTTGEMIASCLKGSFTKPEVRAEFFNTTNNNQ